MSFRHIHCVALAAGLLIAVALAKRSTAARHKHHELHSCGRSAQKDGTDAPPHKQMEFIKKHNFPAK